MALDPHPDREPGMDARVITPEGDEYAKAHDEPYWFLLGSHSFGLDWRALATTHPDATVVLP